MQRLILAIVLSAALAGCWRPLDPPTFYGPRYAWTGFFPPAGVIRCSHTALC